jgi:hypothetical protein
MAATPSGLSCTVSISEEAERDNNTTTTRTREQLHNPLLSQPPERPRAESSATVLVITKREWRSQHRVDELCTCKGAV